MKQTIFCFVVLVGLTALHAQDTQKPPLPAGPLLKRTGENSAWTVVSQKAAGSKSSPAAEESQNKQDPVAFQSQFVKTGDTIWEVTTDAKGVRQEIWRVRGLRVTPVPDHPKPLVFPDFGVEDIHTIDFKTSDFAGLDWISPATYSGVEKWQDQDCLIFRGKVSPLTAIRRQEESSAMSAARESGEPVPDRLLVPAVAYIDVQTRLPLFAQFGDEKRTYQYGSAPTTPLQLPPDVASQVKEYVMRIKRLSAPPSKSF